MARDRHERMRRDARTGPPDKCAKGAATRVGNGAKRAGRDGTAKEKKRSSKNTGSRGTSLRDLGIPNPHLIRERLFPASTCAAREYRHFSLVFVAMAYGIVLLIGIYCSSQKY